MVQSKTTERERETRNIGKPNPQEAIRTHANKLGSEIDAAIDEVSVGKSNFDVKDFLIKSQVSAPVAKQLIEFYKPLYKELQIATGDNDYQMSEGYLHLGKRNMKRLIEFVQSELKMKSIFPEKVVGATECWVFNVKYRKLFQYVAQDGMMLTWKGTTLQNFDPEKSGAKTIRNPGVFFKNIESMTKRPLVKAFNDIKSVLAKATGRISEDVIIVKVF